MKSFDIYLRDRKTDCDILISSLSYYEGLLVNNKMAIGSRTDSEAETCLLHKYIEGRESLGLISDIRKTLKTCYEQVHQATVLCASVEPTTFSLAKPETACMVLDADNIALIATAYEQIASGMELAVAEFAPLSTKRAQANADIELGCKIDKSLKTGYIAPESGFAMLSSASTSIKWPYIPVGAAAIAVAATAGAILRRKRRLTEIDQCNPMMDVSSTLCQLDFIVLEE